MIVGTDFDSDIVFGYGADRALTVKPMRVFVYTETESEANEFFDRNQYSHELYDFSGVPNEKAPWAVSLRVPFTPEEIAHIRSALEGLERRVVEVPNTKDNAL